MLLFLSFLLWLKGILSFLLLPILLLPQSFVFTFVLASVHVVAFALVAVVVVAFFVASRYVVRAFAAVDVNMLLMVLAVTSCCHVHLWPHHLSLTLGWLVANSFIAVYSVGEFHFSPRR